MLLGLLFVDGEVQAELLEDLDRSQRFLAIKLGSDLAGASRKNLEFFALNQVLEVGTLADEFL